MGKECYANLSTSTKLMFNNQDIILLCMTTLHVGSWRGTWTRMGGGRRSRSGRGPEKGWMDEGGGMEQQAVSIRVKAEEAAAVSGGTNATNVPRPLPILPLRCLARQIACAGDPLAPRPLPRALLLPLPSLFLPSLSPLFVTSIGRPPPTPFLSSPPCRLHCNDLPWSAVQHSCRVSFLLLSGLPREPTQSRVVRMGRPDQISSNCLVANQLLWPRRRISLSSAKRGGKKIGGMASVRMAACAVLVWAVVSGVSGSGAAAEAEQDSNLIETKTGWQFADDDIVDFDAPAASPGAAPAPAPAKAISGRVPLADGGFESANVTGNATVVATDGTVLPNWMPGGAGVSVMQSPPYQRSSFDATSKYLVMLNNPASAGNGTQGSITTTLAANPGTGKTFTIQYDCARCPDGPLNLLSAIRVSAIAGSAKTFILHHVPYNATDTQAAITWSRQSFVFEGTGAATSIMLESMSEKYGPMVDNIVQLTGSHVLSAAPPATARLSVWQPVFTVLVVVAMAGFHGCPLTQLLSLL